MTSARHYTRSSSFKMALLFTVLCGLASLILGYFIYYFSHNSFIHTVENAIDTDIRYINLLHQNKTDHSDIQSYLKILSGDSEHLFIYREAGGKNFPDLDPRVPSDIKRLSEGLLVFSRGPHMYAAKIHTFADGGQLLAGIDITQPMDDHKRMLYLSMLSIGLLLIVVGISYAISRFVASRTSRIVLQAHHIMETGDLSQRLDVDSDWDDLSYMTKVLNLFLDRIEDLMQGIRHVSDNIAHDLRTPLTRMRHKIETFRSDPVIIANPSLCQASQSLAQEADQLLATFNALLRISRIESGRQHSPFEPVPLDQIVADVKELYDPVAEEKSLLIQCDLTPVTYRGDRHLLFQAVANIVDNAVKFTPLAGGPIHITLGLQHDVIQLSIRDHGPGIDPADSAKVFERYYRGDQSRHLPGNGLGLSLVQAIICLHGGHISLLPQANGLIVTINLPLS